eukprot:GHVU01167545.1.p1 GENE.GHVU01167545.1~~GHVU01167545.1.p1  ORF type:complete len:810 (-),score=137.39 GHVU01167545.1:645-3074(-)
MSTEEPSEETENKGQKRKRESVEPVQETASPKKQKVEEAAPKSKEKPAVEQAAPEKPEVEEMQEAPSEEPKVQEAPAAPSEEPKVTEAQEAPSEKPKVQEAPTEEKMETETSDEQATSAQVEEQQAEEKPVESPAKQPLPDVPDEAPEEPLKDYVVVNLEDVPPADSLEVNEAAAKAVHVEQKPVEAPAEPVTTAATPADEPSQAEPEQMETDEAVVDNSEASSEQEVVESEAEAAEAEAAPVVAEVPAEKPQAVCEVQEEPQSSEAEPQAPLKTQPAEPVISQHPPLPDPEPISEPEMDCEADEPESSAEPSSTSDAVSQQQSASAEASDVSSSQQAGFAAVAPSIPEASSVSSSEEVAQSTVTKTSELPQTSEAAPVTAEADHVQQASESSQVETQAVPESSEQSSPVHAEHVDGHVSTANNVDGVHDKSISNGNQATSSNDIDSCDSLAASNALFSRQYTVNPNLETNVPVDHSRQFSVVSYNILADCHAQKAQMPWLSAEHLSIESRHKRLLQELKYLDADVVCLQEVEPEHFKCMLQPALRALGYEGDFIKRTDPKVNEGEATFFRSTRFSLESSQGVVLKDLAFRELGASDLSGEVRRSIEQSIDRPAVMLVSKLRCKNTNSCVAVGNIHVTWDNFERADMQCIQVACAVRELLAQAGGPGNAYILAGDFNSWPGSPPYQLLKEGYLNDSSMSILQKLQAVDLADGQKAALVNLWWKGFQHTSTCMKSAYATVLGQDPRTSHHWHDRSLRAVDQIWFTSDCVDVHGVLRTTDPALLRSPPIIPNTVFPSDHLSLKVQLCFKAL